MGTDAESYRRVAGLFQKACELERGDRERFLDEQCSGEPELRAAVVRMLAADASADPVLDQAAAVAADLLASGFDDDEAMPERIGRYRILRRIGAGGMGAVFEAEQDSPRRAVALKLIRPGLWSPTIQRRFLLEADALGRLDHPGIAHIFEAGTADGLPFFAMELVDGVPLTDWCREHELGVRERLELLARICEAVEHAHAKGVVHRDLKPSNVLVQADGQPKIVDFGIARVRDPERDTSGETPTLTGTGQLVGTLAYMSPEQARGDVARVGPLSDVYSLGVVGYELVTARLPYESSGVSIAELARAIDEQDPPPLAEVPAGLRAEVETILARALEKEPERRYASAAQLAADLRRFLADEPILARPPTRIYQIRKFARRNKALFTGVVVAAVALLGATLASTKMYLDAERAREEEQSQKTAAQDALADAETARAEEHRQKLVAEDALRASKTVQDLFLDALWRADPYELKGEDLTVAELFEAASTDPPEGLDEDPHTEAAFRRMVGSVLLDLHRPVLARENLERVVELESELYGPDDPSTIGARTLLGRALYALGEDEAALVVHQGVVDAYRRIGAGPEKVWGDTYFVVHTLRQLGRYREAEELGRQALDELTAIAPEGDQALWAAENHARTLSVQERPEEALAFVLDALATAERVHGPEDRLTIDLLEAASICLNQANRSAEALEMQARLVDHYERMLGPDEPIVLEKRMFHALSLSRLGRYDESIAELREIFEARARVVGIDDSDTRMMEFNLASTHLDAGHFEEALELIDDVLASPFGELVPDGAQRAVVVLLRAQALIALGRHEEALEALGPAYDSMRSFWGEDHEYVRLAIRALADANRGLGNENEAARWEERLADEH